MLYNILYIILLVGHRQPSGCREVERSVLALRLVSPNCSFELGWLSEVFFVVQFFRLRERVELEWSFEAWLELLFRPQKSLRPKAFSSGALRGPPGPSGAFQSFPKLSKAPGFSRVLQGSPGLSRALQGSPGLPKAPQGPPRFSKVWGLKI